MPCPLEHNPCHVLNFTETESSQQRHWEKRAHIDSSLYLLVNLGSQKIHRIKPFPSLSEWVDKKKFEKKNWGVKLNLAGWFQINDAVFWHSGWQCTCVYMQVDCEGTFIFRTSTKNPTAKRALSGRLSKLLCSELARLVPTSFWRRKSARSLSAGRTTGRSCSFRYCVAEDSFSAATQGRQPHNNERLGQDPSRPRLEPHPMCYARPVDHTIFFHLTVWSLCSLIERLVIEFPDYYSSFVWNIWTINTLRL